MTATLSLVSTRTRASSSAIAAFLRTLPHMGRLSDASVDDLADLLDTRKLHKGDVLWRQGDVADTVCIVRSGVVILEGGVAGHEVTLDLCGRGCVLGLAGSRESDAVVHEDGTMLVLERADFERWLVDHPTAAPTFVRVAARQTQQLAQRLALVSMHGAKGRLAMLFLDLAERFGVRDSRGVIIDVRLTHREMAALIGATRETVSVAIVELRQTGWIATESRRVIVVDEEALRGLVGT